MENASKALLMAATILIAVMLISLGTYLFATFGNYSKNINDNINQKEKQEFNAQFTKYETSTTGEFCTVYDIVTIINLARNSNNQYEEYQNVVKRSVELMKDSNIYIYVDIRNDNDINISELSTEQELNAAISKRNKTEYKEDDNKIVYKDLYTCTVAISNQTGLVKSITFTKK